MLKVETPYIIPGFSNFTIIHVIHLWPCCNADLESVGPK